MEDLVILSPIINSSASCVRTISDVGPDVEDIKSLRSSDIIAKPSPPEPLQGRQNSDSSCFRSFLSPGSSCSDALDSFSFLPSRLNSLGEEALSTAAHYADDDDDDDCPELNVDSVHQLICSPRFYSGGGVPRPKVLAHVSGTGLAPWEIHRPQKFVRDLVLRRCFSGRVLDAGCGIGDNALFIAKAAPGAAVTAVDVVPRCLDFTAAKAGLRDMRGKVELVVGDLLEQDPSRLSPKLSDSRDGTFDIVLDSLTFHAFSDFDRERYVATLRRLLRPGGLIYINCMSEEETRTGGGSRRIRIPEVLLIFCASNGWEVETIEDSIIELHPTFWGGSAKARLFTIRKL